MPREYRHIKQYEKEILELREKGLTHREIGERLGFPQIKVKKFFDRYRQNQQKLVAGIAIKQKGRPPKDYAVRRQDKVAELKYILARKDAKDMVVGNGKRVNAGFSLADRKEVRTSVKYMVIYRHKEKYAISQMCSFFKCHVAGITIMSIECRFRKRICIWQKR